MDKESLLVDVWTIECVDSDGKTVAEVKINKKCLRSDVLERALNSMVHDINMNPNSLHKKTFIVREREINLI